MRLRLAITTFSAVLCAGCLSPTLRPSSASLANIERFQVVPMESVPLELSEFSFSNDAGTPGYIPPPAVGSTGAQGTFGALQMLSALPTKPENAKTLLKDAQSKLAALPPWNPAIELSQEASRLLVASGHAATATADVREFPSVEANAMQGKALSNLTAWFNSGSSERAYGRFATGKSAVLELSVRQAIFPEGRVFVQMFVKLIDAQSGEVIGRTKLNNMDQVGFYQMPQLSVDKALDNDAQLLKSTMIGIEYSLLPKCLQELGLVGFGQRQ